MIPFILAASTVFLAFVVAVFAWFFVASLFSSPVIEQGEDEAWQRSRGEQYADLIQERLEKVKN